MSPSSTLVCKGLNSDIPCETDNRTRQEKWTDAFCMQFLFQESWFWSPGYERIYASLILGWAATRMCVRRMQNATSRISYPRLRKDGAYVMHPTSPKKHVVAYLWLLPSPYWCPKQSLRNTFVAFRYRMQLYPDWAGLKRLTNPPHFTASLWNAMIRCP